jgi:hypothetical protein
MTTNQNLDKWEPLVAALDFTLRNARTDWTVQTISKDWDFGPYLQAHYVDSEIIAEITSNYFLQPAMSIHGEHKLRMLGWNRPHGYDYPNWYKVVPHNLQGHEDIAKLWVKTLVESYGMNERWRFSVAPMSIEFVRAWRNEMVPSRVVGTYQLVDSQGVSKPQSNKQVAQKAKAVKKTEDIAAQVQRVLDRGKKLGLAGTDLIRLAQCEASDDVVKSVTALVYGSPAGHGVRAAQDEIQELDLYRPMEFDDFAGADFLESQSVFPEDDDEFVYGNIIFCFPSDYN